MGRKTTAWIIQAIKEVNCRRDNLDMAKKEKSREINIYQMQKNSRCRLWDDGDETANNITSECSKQMQKEYKTRHDWMGTVIHWELCKRLKLNHTGRWCMQKPESVLENEKNKIQ